MDPMPARFTLGRHAPTLILVSTLGLPCLAGPAFSAQRDRPPPSITVTTRPGTADRGPHVKVKTDGPVGNKFTSFETADKTTFDLTDAAFVSTFEHPKGNVFMAGNQPEPPKDLRVVGGVADGGIPLEWNWRLVHGFGGAAFYTVARGTQVLDGVRIHNFEDGWHPRETPNFRRRSYPNTSRFVMRNCYVTGIRDDVIENDEFLPGEIDDCLFDGVWTMLSEQNERQNAVRREGVPTVGPDEDPFIRLNRALVRITVTNANETGPGRWFKLQPYGSTSHRLSITDSVFAIDQAPRNGWRLLNFPKDATYQGTNYILWLGTGPYQAEIPPGVKFLEGQAAKDKWHQVRNGWLVRHGYEPRSPNDWDPMKAPVAAPRRK